MKKIFWFLVIVVITVALIKFVPQVNSFARDYLPEGLLELIGENPKGIFEKGLDKVGDVMESLSN